MPELPEVETIVSDLNKKIVEKEISAIDIRLAKIVKNKKKYFLDFLLNNKFRKIGRRGKLIIFYFDDPDKFLLVHLRMTGQLIYRNKNQIIAGGHSQDKTLDNLPNKYTHLIFYFKNKTELFYNDLRQFGYLQLVNKKKMISIMNRFGYEPLGRDFSLVCFEKLIKKRNKNIKAFLLDQSLVAGLGNIYVDEVLFASKIRPQRNVNTLKEKEIKNIYNNIKKILRKAIKYRGTTFNDYRDADGKKGEFLKMLQVYGRDNKECLECGAIIKKIKIAGRGTRYCSKCQS